MKRFFLTGQKENYRSKRKLPVKKKTNHGNPLKYKEIEGGWPDFLIVSSLRLGRFLDKILGFHKVL